ncbi:MAG TPA: metallophosphoesterase [Solirubrobacteraceae bacterium]|nr:metallophosphoesterase [Solirubrobacteraceae bacterium]
MQRRALMVILAAAALTAAGCGKPVNEQMTLAVIGDTPYGPEQIAAFPELVDDVNGDPDVDAVLHLGDVKLGSSPCTDERLQTSLHLYQTFTDPFVLTPGDNEWTDCHQLAAGRFMPTERLERVRELFYPKPGTTLGVRPMRVDTQSADPAFAEFVENTLWVHSEVVFSTVHVVGSRNALAPWFGGQETQDQRERRQTEYEHRLQADLAWLRRTFAEAERQGARGIVVGMHADSFAADRRGMEAVNARMEELAAAFDGPVLLLQGDTHLYKVDRPLAGARNLTRVVVEGETAQEWLRLRVDPGGDRLFSWERQLL